ncbi:hypothetical protein [Spiroplasma culicicola]|uniref:Transmembrane protein n=1 Tax=Spiroplasma culicicola AES-1 TaxID=1276246 RepID=W6A8C5_9MOLU|nr:hypothetical protein [Spiroplasma culicicola]AHI53247.1 hypothetical protein SCULI_v1c09070 [Spiroplasma culicicola AES-1]
MKRDRILKYSFYVWFTIVPFFCILLDLLFSTIQPDPEYGDRTQNFDFSIINQMIYLSVWISFATSLFGLCNWIHFHHNNMPSWLVGKNNITRLATLNVFAFILYNITLIVSTVVGFNTWYKILKSVLEHMITPVLFIVFYFVFANDKVDNKQYLKRYSWFNLMHVGLYMLFIAMRGIMITQFIPNIDDAFTPWPYDQLNPDIVGYPLFFLGIFAIFAGMILLAVFLNYLSNLKIHKLNKNRTI